MKTYERKKLLHYVTAKEKKKKTPKLQKHTLIITRHTVLIKQKKRV
jgi:hypothetical protein